MANDNFKMPTAESLKATALENPAISMAFSGTLWLTTLEEVSTGIGNMIVSMSNLEELDSIIFIPDYDRSIGNLTPSTKCFALFDPRLGNYTNIWPTGQKIGGSKLMVDLGEHGGANGRFGTSATFNSTMAKYVFQDSIIECRDGYRIKIEEYRDDSNRGQIVPIVELDIMRVFAAALGISEAECINLSIMSASPTKNDFSIMLAKYIDTSNARRFGRSHRGGTDMRSVKDGLRYRYSKTRNRGPQGGNDRRGRSF